MVRIGSEEAPLAQRARDVWVDGLVRQYTGLHPEAHSQGMAQHIRAATQLSRTIAEVVAHLSKSKDQVCLTRSSPAGQSAGTAFVGRGLCHITCLSICVPSF